MYANNTKKENEFMWFLCKKWSVLFFLPFLLSNRNE